MFAIPPGIANIHPCAIYRPLRREITAISSLSVKVNSLTGPGDAPLSPAATVQRKALPGAHERDVRTSGHAELRPGMKDRL